MKKILLLFMVCTLLPRIVMAQEPDGTLNVSDLTYDSEFTWDDGAHTGAYYFTVSLTGTTIYSAYNLEILLPVGIHVIYGLGEDEDEESYLVYLNHDSGMYPKSSGNYTHSITCNLIDSYLLRVACFSSKNSNLKHASGHLFNVYVTLDNKALSASFSPKPLVKLSGMNLTKSDETAYHPADYSCHPFTTEIPAARSLPVNVTAANKIGTLILPFDADLPSGVKAYSCNAIGEGDLLTLTPVGSFEACTPYIIYAESGFSGSISGSADLSADYGTTDVFTDGYLTGVLSNTTVSTGYILQNQGSGPMFYDAEGVTFSLPAGRCYLTPPTTSGVKAFGFSFGTETSITERVNSKSVNEKFFDLSGRVAPQNMKKGIYIRSDKKIIVK